MVVRLNPRVTRGEALSAGAPFGTLGAGVPGRTGRAMRSRSRITLLVTVLSVLLASPVGMPSAVAADEEFTLRVTPDHGPAGTAVTVSAYGDPQADGSERTVAWVCDWFAADDQIIGTATVTNHRWTLLATVRSCVSSLSE